MSAEERLDMERQYHDREGTQARYAGRLKFACCRQCGSPDGMQGIHRDTLAEVSMAILAMVMTKKLRWYREPGNSQYLFYSCPVCNQDCNVPPNFVPVMDVLVWLDTDSMSPNYEALAAEPVAATAGQDSRASAGL